MFLLLSSTLGFLSNRACGMRRGVSRMRVDVDCAVVETACNLSLVVRLRWCHPVVAVGTSVCVGEGGGGLIGVGVEIFIFSHTYTYTHIHRDGVRDTDVA